MSYNLSQNADGSFTSSRRDRGAGSYEIFRLNQSATQAVGTSYDSSDIVIGTHTVNLTKIAAAG